MDQSSVPRGNVWDERSDAERAAHDGKHYLCSISFNCTAESPEAAAEEFRTWLLSTKHPTVTVNPIPFPAGGVVEVEL